MILLVAGLSVLAGCAALEKVHSVADVVTTGTLPANCPPIIPILPGVTDAEIVILFPEDQQALLLYFHQVERCYESAQGIGL